MKKGLDSLAKGPGDKKKSLEKAFPKCFHV
jgi:hypothetical protein